MRVSGSVCVSIILSRCCSSKARAVPTRVLPLLCNDDCCGAVLVVVVATEEEGINVGSCTILVSVTVLKLLLFVALWLLLLLFKVDERTLAVAVAVTVTGTTGCSVGGQSYVACGGAW